MASSKVSPIIERKQEDVEKAEKDVALGLRRSSRNLPEHLKEKLVGQKEEIEEREPKDIDSLKPINFEGKIKFTDDFYRCAELCASVIEKIEKSTDEVIPVGFDLEWPFSFQTGSGKTALAQVCLSEDVCYLFHLFKMTKLPAAFVVLLSHPKVRLVGVKVKNDVRKLGRDFKGFPDEKVVNENCIECGPYANEVYRRSGSWSLERLTAYLLKKKISKDNAVRMSQWHNLPLNDAQQLYAATDAYVSWLIYVTINKKERELAALEAEGNSENVENEQQSYEPPVKRVAKREDSKLKNNSSEKLEKKLALTKDLKDLRVVISVQDQVPKKQSKLFTGLTKLL